MRVQAEFRGKYGMDDEEIAQEILDLQGDIMQVCPGERQESKRVIVRARDDVMCCMHVHACGDWDQIIVSLLAGKGWRGGIISLTHFDLKSR